MTTAVQSLRLRAQLTPRAWSVLTALGLWLATGWLVWHRVALPGSTLDFHAFSHVDFRDSVWLAVHDFVHGGVPWDSDGFTTRHPEAQFFPIYLPSYFYPAMLLLLLPYQLAAALWVGLLVAALVWLVHRCLQLWMPARLARMPWLVPLTTALLLGTRPVQTAVSQGNWAMLCAAGSVLALTSPRRDRSLLQWRGWLADPVVWGVAAALVKPPVGLALVVVLACTRRLSRAVWGVLVTVLLSLPIAAVVVHRMGGFGAAFDLLTDTVNAGDGATPGYAHYTRIDISSTVGRLLAHPTAGLLLFVFVATAALAVATLVASHRRFGVLDPRTVSAAALTIVLLTPNLHYAMIVLVPALVSLVARLLRAPQPLPGLVLALLLVPMVSPVRGGAVACISPQAANLVYSLCLVAALVVTATWTAVTGRRQPAAVR